MIKINCIKRPSVAEVEIRHSLVLPLSEVAHTQITELEEKAPSLI